MRGGLHAAVERSAEQVGGFDDRRLIKLELNTSLDPSEFVHISPGIEIVSQEERNIVLAFADETALATFEARFTTLAEGGRPPYRNLLFALESFDNWTEADRRGWSLAQEGFPDADEFVLDVELWPVSSPTERESCWQAFEAWLREQQIERIDAIKQAHLILFRLRTNRAAAQLLLHHRDVRTVDLPPRYGMAVVALHADIAEFAQTPAPPAEAPAVAVLDSGLAAGHPFLAPAVGDAQSFVTGLSAEDEHGHGTYVAGIALYGDLEAAWRARAFVPNLRLFSGRILDSNNANDGRFIENQIEEAVRYFHREYGCRVFNLSYGDLRKPYIGRHVRGLAVTLDTLTREMGVLFVVPTGNFDGGENEIAWREEYPGYLLSGAASILDPATALNVLTVGALARWDRTFSSQRYVDDATEQPIARRNQPSPFTRSGPSVNGAIKPDVVAYGGNWAVNVRTANQWITRQGLGELSTSRDFAMGRLLAEDVGTSFAAPQIAHFAARILAEYPRADHNLLRALLVLHARYPDGCEAVLPNAVERLRVCGYGQVDSQYLERSQEQDVTLIAEDSLPDKHHHFYEIPLPDSFVDGKRRSREIAVALAYSPPVRTTRVAYKSCDMEFRLVWATDFDHVSRMFNAATSADDYSRIAELGNPRVGARNRGAGTAQADCWTIRLMTEQRRTSRLFVVVTRIDKAWGRGLTLTAEPYALAVGVRDRENTEARLYTQLQARLRARVQARVRA
jgi:hypothetical protein